MYKRRFSRNSFAFLMSDCMSASVALVGLSSHEEINKYDFSPTRGTNMIDLMTVSICLSEMASDALIRIARSSLEQTSFKGMFKSRTISFISFSKREGISPGDTRSKMFPSPLNKIR